MAERPIIVKRGGTSAWSIGCGIFIGFVLIVAIIIGVPVLLASFARIEQAKAEIAAREERQRSAAAPAQASIPVIPKPEEKPATQPPSQPPDTPKIPEVVWTPATEALKVGDFEISIGDIRVGKPKLKGVFTDKEIERDDAAIMVTVTVKNLSERKKVDARGFVRDFGGPNPTLRDDVDNSYHLSTGGISAFVGATLPASIYPGKQAADVLCFEPPVDGFKGLTLEIPLESVGLPNQVARFRIDPADVKR